MHEYGIIHRDIKGENFMFVEDPAFAVRLCALNLLAWRLSDANAWRGCTQELLLLLCQIKHGRQPVVKLIDLGMSLMYDPKRPVTGVRHLQMFGFTLAASACQCSKHCEALATATRQTAIAWWPSANGHLSLCAEPATPCGVWWSRSRESQATCALPTLQARWGPRASCPRRRCTTPPTSRPWTSSAWGWCCS